MALVAFAAAKATVAIEVEVALALVGPRYHHGPQAPLAVVGGDPLDFQFSPVTGMPIVIANGRLEARAQAEPLARTKGQ